VKIFPCSSGSWRGLFVWFGFWFLVGGVGALRTNTSTNSRTIKLKNGGKVRKIMGDYNQENEDEEYYGERDPFGDGCIFGIFKTFFIGVAFVGCFVGGFYGLNKLAKKYLQQSPTSPPAITQPANTNLSYNSSFTPVRVADSGLDKKISEI